MQRKYSNINFVIWSIHFVIWWWHKIRSSNKQRKVDGLPKLFLLKMHIALEQLSLALRRDCLHRHFQRALSRPMCHFQLWHGIKTKAGESHENPARLCWAASERRATRVICVVSQGFPMLAVFISKVLFIGSNLLVPGSDGRVIYGCWQNKPLRELSLALIKGRDRLPSGGPFHWSWEDSNLHKSHKGGQIHLTDCMMSELMVRKRAIIVPLLVGCFRKLLLHYLLECGSKSNALLNTQPARQECGWCCEPFLDQFYKAECLIHNECSISSNTNTLQGAGC